MSHWQQLLDLEGQTLTQNSIPAASIRLPEDLQGPTLLISDFASAPFGVDTLPAHSKRLAPLVEKRLREQGEIDGLAQVLIHTSEQQGNIARVFYTAVPVTQHLSYHQLCKNHTDNLLIFPLADALLALACQQELNDGLLLFVHGQCVDLLMLREGQVRAAKRLRRFDDEAIEQQRLASAIQRIWQDEASSEADLVVVEQVLGAAASLNEFLAQKGIIKAVPLTLTPSHLFSALNLFKAAQSPTERLSYLSAVSLPWVAMLMVLFCLLTGALMVHWRLDTMALQASLPSTNLAAGPLLRQTISTALQDAEQLSDSQQTLTDFIQLAERARRVPDPASLIQHLRNSTPADITLTEASIVSNPEGGLIIVVGRSQSAAAPLGAENDFVKALEAHGYQVVRREIEGGAGSSLFRLALTWSEP